MEKNLFLSYEDTTNTTVFIRIFLFFLKYSLVPNTRGALNKRGGLLILKHK